MAKSNSVNATDIADLDGLDTDTLRQRWAELYGLVPLARISRDVLIRGVAFRIQEDAHGGMSKSSRRELQRLARALRDGGRASSRSQVFKPGTKLIREWQGTVHEVVIADDTYIWAGKHYRSLSQIARSITGTRWSGPRFFGLEAKTAKQPSGRTTDG